MAVYWLTERCFKILDLSVFLWRMCLAAINSPAAGGLGDFFDI